MNTRFPLLLSSLGLAAVLLPATQPAHADDEVLEGKLRACTSDGTVIGGVKPCGKAWRIRSGEVELDRDGELEVEIKGLVLDDPSTGEANGTADGVTHVVASLVCGGSSGTVVAESDRFPLGKKGNAEFEARLSLPAQCTAPIILVREVWEGKAGGWLAVTGY